MVLRSQVEPAPVDVGLVASEAQHSLRGRADPGHPQATRVAPGGPLHRLLRGVHAVLRGHVHVQLHAVRVPVGGYHAVVEVVHGPSEEREVVLKGGGQKLHRQLHARASEPEGRQARRHARRRQQAQRRRAAAASVAVAAAQEAVCCAVDPRQARHLLGPAVPVPYGVICGRVAEEPRLHVRVAREQRDGRRPEPVFARLALGSHGRA
mmetsp:Transcript_21603/g.55425  ORF Transcript_21603/g.55425 Transcript_21603/m.55425 type:complete len:208 (-) Transcript_21603:245-868(-)